MSHSPIAPSLHCGGGKQALEFAAMRLAGDSMNPLDLAKISFGEQSEARWRALAAKALKGADVDAALTSATDDGIAIQAHMPRMPNASPIFARTHAGWAVVQRVDDPNVARAAAQAKEDIEGGATGLSLVFEGAANANGFGLPTNPDTLPAVLDGINLDGLTLRIDSHPQARNAADWLADYLRLRKANLKSMHLSLGIDPASILASTGRLKMTIDALEASLPQSLAGFFAAGLPGVLLEADSRPYHNAGASEAQELGTVLSVATSHLRMFEKARQPIRYAASHIGFALALDQDQFVSIAKLRALRLLWSRVLELSGIKQSIPTHIHAETSWRMITQKDSENNILRSSIAAFSASIGGADSLSVLPHTSGHGLPESFARRIARNTQLVLKEEASTGFVDDPIAGSGSLEALTSDLCEKAWAEFQTLESEGGVLRSLAAGLLQKRIENTAAARYQTFENGERTIVGVTAFQTPVQRPVQVLEATRPHLKLDAAFHAPPLVPQRLSAPFEGGEA